MTILYYFEGEGIGGVTTAIEHLVRHMDSQHNVIVVCSDNPNLEDWRARVSATGAQVIPCALRNRQDLLGWFDVGRMRQVFRLFRKTDVAHFHLHTLFACQAAVVLSALARVPVRILTEHFIFHLDYLRRRPLRYPLFLLREVRIYVHMMLNRLVFRLSNGIITLSEINRKYLQDHLRPPEKLVVEVIPNGVDTKNFTDEMYDVAALRASFGVKSRRTFLVATVADLNNAKGHEYLIRAVPEVVRHVPEVLFLFVGNGHLRRDLENLVSSIGIEKWVQFTGYRTDIPRILAGADLFVLPSLFEAMPLSVLEAMAAGLAVVTTTGGALREVVLDQETGYLVSPRDPQALADRIVALLEDPGTRRSFGMRGRERVIRQFEASQIAKRHRDFYAKLFARLKERNQ